MTKREMNLCVFQGKPIPHVFFQPRIEAWYAWHKQFGLLPAGYEDVGLLELYDKLDLSMRYTHHETGMPDPIQRTYSKKVRINRHTRDGKTTTVIETPFGDLVSYSVLTVDKTWRTIKFPVKDSDDLRKLRWLYQNTTFTFDRQRFRQGSEFIGERGEPQFWLPHSPYQELCLGWMKLADLIYALHDAPADVEATMQAIDDSYDALYEEVAACDEVRIVNFGENIHAQLLSPHYFEKHLIPFYEKRAGQLKRAGIYTHIHIDGYFKPLLPYLKDLPFDGLEALTPFPQGDVSIEEMRAHTGDKVLLDGIPGVLFLPQHSDEELAECVEKLVELFHPRLVLGISDELPQGAGVEGIERVKWISDYCKSACPSDP